MKYYLTKEEHYENGKFTYKPIKEVNYSTRSREIMIYDENKNNIWYACLIDTPIKLIKLKKSLVPRQLDLVSIEKQHNESLETFHEVSENLFFEYLEIYQFLLRSNSDFREETKSFKKIMNEIKRITVN